MKKIIKIALITMVMTAVLAGCGKKDTEAVKDGSQAGVDSSLTDIQKKGKLILGLDDAFPPMGFRDDNQEIVGFDIDAAKEVAKRMGIELVVTPISWDAKEQELSTKHIDCIWNGFTSNAEREKQMTLSKPYMQNTQVVVVLSDSGIKSLDDLAGKKVAIQNGSTASDAMENNKEFKDSLKSLAKVEDNVQALMDLKVGGSDAVVMDEVVARYYVEKEPVTYTILDSALADEEYVIGFRKEDKALCDEVYKQLETMAEDGTLKTLSEKWLGKDLTIVK